jgi:hypothetical protein
MSTTHNQDRLVQLRAEVAVVEAAMQQAACDALLAHKRTGQPVVIWQDGKVVWVPADQIPFDDATPSH